MAFPESGILDNFNRDNEGPPLSASWTEMGFAGGGLKVNTNEAQQEAVGSCLEYWNVETFGPNCEAYVTFAATNAKSAVYTRLQTPAGANVDGYVLEADALSAPNVLKISRLDDNSRTQLGASINQAAMAAGDDFGLGSSGTDHTAYYNDGGAGWGDVGSRSDATYQGAGYIGIKIYHPGATSARLDDFGGGTLAAAGRTTHNTDSHPLGIHSGMGHRFGNP